ncbi:MAG: hypothetical protein IKB99_09585 [Lentisphaeria bacterium]|nr:hypothetical protein [Lentisphaeria bacterium]
MKKLFTVVLLFFAFSVFAAKVPEFSVKVILTKAVNIGDQFRYILSGRPPVFPQVAKVVSGERFFVEIVFSGAAVKQGAVLLNGKITTCAPRGKKDVILLKEQSLKMQGGTRGVFLLPQHLSVTVEPQDARGLHRFEVELTDKNSGVTAKSSAQVEYVKSVPAASEDEALKNLGNYYRAPRPENILPAFRAYLKKIPAQKKREKRNFNPLPQLALFYFALKENPQCIDAFAGEVAKLKDKEQKMYGGIILNFLSEKTAQRLSAAEKQQIARIVPRNPFEVKKVSAPWHLDICWAEFFIRGTREPLMKIVNALALGKNSISIPDFKKLNTPTSKDRRRLFNGLIAMAAEWSVNSLAKQHHLVRFYIEAALQRGEVKDPFTGAAAARAIGMKVRIVPGKK